MAYFLKKTKLKNRTYLAIYESFYDPKRKETAHRCYKSLQSVETHIANGIADPIAYVLDEDRDLYTRLNKELVEFGEVSGKYDIEELRELIMEHTAATGSQRGKEILDDFENYIPKFKKIVPHDYKKMMAAIAVNEEKGMNAEQARIEAFHQITDGRGE